MIENKNKLTENNTLVVTYETDIKVEKVLIKHACYPTTPQNINSSPVIYGNNIKIYLNELFTLLMEVLIYTNL